MAKWLLSSLDTLRSRLSGANLDLLKSGISDLNLPSCDTRA